MTRYINNLPDLCTDVLNEMYENGLREINNTCGDENACNLTINQLHFIRKILYRRGFIVRDIEEVVA